MRDPDPDPHTDLTPDSDPAVRAEQVCRVPLIDGVGLATLRVPDDWVVVPDLPDTVPLVTAGPIDESVDLRPTLVLTLERLPRWMALESWQRSVDMLNEGHFDRYLLIDLDRVEVAGRPGMRRLATYLGPHELRITIEQWMVIAGSVDRVGVTVTASCVTDAYPANRATAERAIATLTIGEEEEP